MDQSLQRASDLNAEIACPTCGAEQSWSDQCRRCKSDLSDLYSVWRESRRARFACLSALRAGDYEQALDRARRCVALCPGDRAARLLTVCHLVRGEWRDALRAARPFAEPR